ncbi:MAG: response regulator transcription factor [Chloroflexota bacterium]
MNDKILVVDDDPNLVELIHFNLEADGYNVVTAIDGQKGIQAFYQARPDLVVLDVSMPKLDGYEVCQRVREVSNTPVIMLTAMGREEDIIKGLDLGADDYLTKPFRIGELLARVRATLRRARSELETDETLRYQDAYLGVDLDARRVTIQHKLIKLTPIEYKLLAFLLKNKGRVLEFRQILEHVWGFEYIDDIDYLRVYIWHLRKKIEPDPKNAIYILNELNTGYRFEPQV